MSASKYDGHTPGPWSLDDDVAAHIIVRGPQREDKYVPVIADVTAPLCRRTDEPGPAIAAMEANARLIADAPALLAENARLRERAERAEARYAETEAERMRLREALERIARDGESALPTVSGDHTVSGYDAGYDVGMVDGMRQASGAARAALAGGKGEA